ncbi:MAG: KH domain-containing protein [Candidatus Pacebacteria bacterium]|nr:KH domain-containing protein [Candidatus Paceibacterota bacterium]
MANSTFADQEFLEYLVKSLVDHPEDVKIDRTVDERGVFLVLHVNAADMGQVVGRKGVTAIAIRSLLKIVGIKNNARVNFKIAEPEGGTHEPRPVDENSRTGEPIEEN